MPCFDPQDQPRVVERVVNGVSVQWKVEAERLSARCDALTKLLCKAGRARKNKTDIPVDVLNWWDEHCEIDRKHGEPW
jgi:hypothetical protein